MKIYRKNHIAPNKALDAETKPVEETKVVKAGDAEPEEVKMPEEEASKPTVMLTEDEINQIKDLLPTLLENLPKIIQLLTGEATIEIIDDDEEETVVEEDEVPTEEEVVEEDEVPTDETEETEEVEEEKAEDDAPFDAQAILKDPNKRAAIEKALQANSSTTKSEDAAPAVAAGKKVFVKKTLPKKAGDSEVIKTRPNAKLVETPAERKPLEEKSSVKKFDFHKRSN